MKLSIDFGRRTTMKIALAVAGALAIGGAIGSALAIGPTMDAPIAWAGGVEFVSGSQTSSAVLYTVPAGRNLMLTDLVVSNLTSSDTYFNVWQTGAGCNPSTRLRLHNVVVRANDITTVALQTGIGFPGGTSVCLASPGTLTYNGRGFLFTPAPAS